MRLHMHGIDAAAGLPLGPEIVAGFLQRPSSTRDSGRRDAGYFHDCFNLLGACRHLLHYLWSPGKSTPLFSVSLLKKSRRTNFLGKGLRSQISGVGLRLNGTVIVGLDG